jgi:hypothetical protein
MKILFYVSAMLLMATGIRAQDKKAAANSSEALYVTIGGKWKALNNEIIFMTKEELIAAGGLIPSDHSFRVAGFKMSAAGSDFQYTEVDGNGAKFTDDMITLANRLKAGCKVYFEYIKCTTSDGPTRMVSPLQVTIK